MADFASIDYFTDQSLVANPQPYFDYLRSRHPGACPIHHGVLAVTGWDTANAVYKDQDSYSACIAVGGPFTPVPFIPEGDDITDQIKEHHGAMPMAEHMITMDPPEHTDARSVLSRLLTPKRLKENEDFMWRLADRRIDRFINDGQCEFLDAYAKPFTLLVIADLLGVPEEDHEQFREAFDLRPGQDIGSFDHTPVAKDPLGWADDKIGAYLEDRRRAPRDDVLTALATARYPDGSLPKLHEVVHTATFLFAAGQETTAKMLGVALQTFGERPDIQEQLREDRSLIPGFVEECLRIEGPTKTTFRMARKSTKVDDIDVPAGTTVMVCLAAANHDPSRFDDPHEFRLDRKNVREHIAFGRGVHSCPGAPLARVEGRVSIERILDRMADISIDEDEHGPAEQRRYTYEPTFIMRGLTDLHIKFRPIG